MILNVSNSKMKNWEKENTEIEIRSARIDALERRMRIMEKSK